MPCGKRRKSVSVWDLIDAGEWSALAHWLRDKDSPRLPASKRRYVTDAKAKLPLLSFALWRGAPQVIVEDILKLYPESVEVLDNLGRLPLHLACFRGRSPAVIDVLLEFNSVLVMVQDRKGNLPLHYAVEAACRGGCCLKEDDDDDEQLDSHLDVLTSLLVPHPMSAVVSNRQGETPVSLSKRLDKRARRAVYRMLVGTNKTFNNSNSMRTSKLLSEEFTAPSSSIFLDGDPSMSVFFLEPETTAVEMSWSETERQAMGERPQRRNGIVIQNMPSSFDSY